MNQEVAADLLNTGQGMEIAASACECGIVVWSYNYLMD